MAYAPVPRLDFGLYTDGSPAERAEFCEQLANAFRRWGFVQLENYGISPAAVHELFDWSRLFFALTHEQKMTVPHPPEPNPHRGYSYIGQEFTSELSRTKEQEARQARRILDVKESFDFGSATDKLYPSVWPPGEILPGFQAFIEQFFAQTHALHLEIMSALAEGIGLDKKFFLTAHERNESEMRLAHYPAIAASALGDAHGTSRICEHTDSGSTTLLWQDAVGGLEIEDPATRRFLPVASPYPALLVNLGDAMEHWSNGVLQPAYHRVTQPTAQDPHSQIPARFSIAYFGKPDRGFSLAPLDQFVTAENPAKFSQRTGADLHQGTLLRTYEPPAVEV